ncbi:MAG: hypothetical protein IPL78_21270 [Chloroflexi bacterium]|nr:hypothetical protein [Chloroflexota bacterium]
MPKKRPPHEIEALIQEETTAWKTRRANRTATIEYPKLLTIPYDELRKLASAHNIPSRTTKERLVLKLAKLRPDLM